MPTIKSGSTILNAIRDTLGAGGNIDYQDRIPEATQENLADVGKALFQYKPQLNQFLDELINRIGMVYIHRKLYKNKLSFFKRGMLEYGDTIEDIFVDIAHAITYSPTAPEGNENDVFKQFPPQVMSAFHKLNREDVYPMTINEQMLKRAFTSYTNFDSFIAGLFDSIYRADEVDEFLLFKQLIGETVKNSHLVHVTKPTDTATSEDFSILLRANALNLEYVTRKYNPAQVATNTNIEDQVLLLRSDIVPVLDVKQLANNFNLNLGQAISGRIVVVDDFGSGNDDILGAIVDKDFSMIYDTLYRTDSIYNPLHMYWQYFMHHHQVIASSPFSNAIGFTTANIVNAITSVTINPETLTIRKGYSGRFSAYVEFTGEIDTSVSWAITNATSSATKVTDGYVVVGADETATTLTLSAKSTADETKTSTATINVI